MSQSEKADVGPTEGPSKGPEGVNIVQEEDHLIAEIDEQLQSKIVRH